MWLIIAVICFAAGVHQTVIKGIGESYLFFVFTFFALLFFLYHRNRAKNATHNF